MKQGTAYCLVEKTGLDTEVGHAARLMQQNSGRRVGLLESKILGLAKCIILGTLVVVVGIVVVQVFVRHQDWRLVVVRALSLTIAAVPVALPLVMQIMMAVSHMSESSYSFAQNLLCLLSCSSPGSFGIACRWVLTRWPPTRLSSLT